MFLYSSLVRCPFSAIAFARFRYAFSTSTIDESTITPTARIIPPSDIMLLEIPNVYIRINEMRTEIGSSIRIRIILLKWSRNIATIIATTIDASSNAFSRVPTASFINVLLS